MTLFFGYRDFTAGASRAFVLMFLVLSASSLWSCSAEEAASTSDSSPEVLDTESVPDTIDAADTTSEPMDLRLPTPDGGCKTNTECVFADQEKADPCLTALCIEGECIIGLSDEPMECDDENPCTTEDGCGPTGCSGAPMLCDDDDICTDDSCLGGDCLNLPNAVPCYDNDPCTVSDSCKGGSCDGIPRSCTDENPCTVDSCDPELGCTFLPKNGACNDGDPCTQNDVCTNSQCTGVAIECEDNNPCTEESCVGGEGCVSDLVLGSCEDGNPCTTGDSCGYGLCLPGLVDFDIPGCSSSECGDGSCGESESCQDCWWDCGHCCGDGYCRVEMGENCATCNTDCGVCDGCGDDLCNASTGEDCNTCPSDCGVCDDVCVSALNIQCGQMIAGSLMAATSTNAIDDYLCLESNHSGNEQSFTLKTDCDGIVHVNVEKHGGFAGLFNIFVLDGALPCRGDACIASGEMDTPAPTNGNATSSFQAWAYHDYKIVVDGAQGALGTYTLSVDCTCEIPDENCADLIDNDLDSKTDCDDPECAAPCPLQGNGCADPFEISSLPFTDIGSTTGLTDSLATPTSCADIYAGKGSGAPDAIYRLEIPQTGLYAATISSANTEFDSALYLLWTCTAAPEQCPAAHNVPGNGGEQIFFLAQKGAERFIVIDGVTINDSGPYELEVAFYGAVEVNCSDGMDDDDDGKTDCADPDCSTSAACSQ